MNHRDHWDNVRALGCVVSRSDVGVTMHHCHGGSIIDWFGYEENPGMAQRQNHFLVIPLVERYHTGKFGIDNGMGILKGAREWEGQFGSQVSHLIWVNEQLPYDIFDLAGVPNPEEIEHGRTNAT